MSPDLEAKSDSSNDLIMVRHTAVADDLKGVCYGASDVALSAAGQRHAETLAVKLAALQPALVIHSGLSRARILAEAITARLDIEATVDPRIAEFDFGAWELCTWDEIFRQGADIARIIHEPATFAPPGGETLHAMRDRVVSWHRELKSKTSGRCLAISHGGPISTLRGVLQGAPETNWPQLIPAYGEQVVFDGKIE
ncbi:MAG: histidine phosphatase family protein [Filomicrobium sp.]